MACGDAAVGRAFSALPFHHLLFTGATAVGREVMRAAAENLTPVTLELGGKSPAIVAPDANLERAAADIVYGKLLNSGQTCIAPDYVLVPEASLRPFVDALRKAVDAILSRREYTSIINEKQHQRLRKLSGRSTRAGRGNHRTGSNTGRGAQSGADYPDQSARRSAGDARGDFRSHSAAENLSATIDEAIAYVNQHDRPLALYLFAHDQHTIDRVLTRTVSGGVCVNDTLLHIAAEDLPFGGVGASGMGHYHGRKGSTRSASSSRFFAGTGSALAACSARHTPGCTIGCAAS